MVPPLKKIAALLAALFVVASISAQDAAVKVAVLSAPKPQYPPEARMHRMHGTGVYEMQIDVKTGLVTSVAVVKTSGSWMLDQTAVNTFGRWRFRPNTLSKARMPVTWALP